MKKLFVTAIAIFTFSITTHAQDVDFGLKAGLNIANVLGGDVDRNNLFDFHAGAFAEFKVSEKFSLQPEIVYSRQGTEVENIATIKLDYINVPLLAKYYISEKVSVEAGPQMSFLVDDKVVFSEDLTFDTDAASFDFGLNAGLAYQISSKFSIQTRYYYGITTVSENPDIKNSVFQVSLGYKF